MKRNNFFASMSCKAFAIAVTLIMGLTISSCKKDSDNKPEPEIPANTAIIDGDTKPVSGVTIDKGYLDDNKYRIFLYFSDYEYIRLEADYYHDGKTIDLTKKEPDKSGWTWLVRYVKYASIIFYADGGSHTPMPAFISGTLYIKRLEDDADGNPVFEIKLENGRLEDADGKEHTISLNYKGSLELA